MKSACPSTILLAEVSADRVIGGAERMLRGQALGLRALGGAVGLSVRAPQNDARASVAVGDSVEQRYAVRRASETAFVLSSFQRATQSFDRACAGTPPDAVVIHQAMAGLGPMLRRRAVAKAWVYMCLSLAHEEYVSRNGAEAGSGLRYRANIAVRRWCEGLVMRRCDRVIVMSEFMKRRVQAVHGIAGERLHVIPGAVDTTRFMPAGDRASVRRQLGWPADRTVLVTVRNLVPRMGLEHFIRAVAMVKAARPDMLALIGGEGPLRADLERRIRELGLTDHVRLTGFIPEGDLPKCYQAADLVVMPTHELEGFGLVTVEALACGTPVLGTPVGATPEILSRVDSCLLTAGTQPEALADSLRTLLDRFRADPGEREKLAARGLALVQNGFTWERHCTQLAAVLADAVADRMRQGMIQA
jgi:glycosyltransferase involved in cell wall biosynthesis